MSDRRERTRDAGGDRLPPVADPDLGRALRGLPRERAAAGFTRRVLDRLDSTNGSPVPRTREVGGLRWAAASALAALALALLVALNAPEVDPVRVESPAPAADAALRVESMTPEAPTAVATPAPEPVVTPPPVRPTPTTVAAATNPPERRSERLAALDAERARIARELAEIRRLAHEPLPVVYVGGDETVDFVVDLQSLSRMARLDGSDPGDRTLRPNGYTIEDPERNDR
jgi:hypothetical protein